MSEADIAKQVAGALEAQGLEPGKLEALSSQLLWRIGRSGDEGPVTVRLGFAGSLRLFAELPKLKTVSDGELESAVKTGDIRVEWVGLVPSQSAP